MPVMTGNRYLTVEELAEALQMHPETVRDLLRKGHLPGKKVGKEWRTSQQQLEEYIRGEYKPEKQRKD